MDPFPVEIDHQTYASSEALAAEITRRGREGVLGRPGQRYPAEALEPALRDPSKALALAAAAALVITRSTDSDVLLLCAHIGGRGHLPYYRAVAERLDARLPLPDAPGSAEPTVAHELANTLADRELTDAAVIGLGAAAMARLGLHGPRLYVLQRHDPDGLLAQALLDAAASAHAWTGTHAPIGLAVFRVAKASPERLLDIARALSAFPESVRAQAASKVERANPSWWSTHGSTFTRLLGSSS